MLSRYSEINVDFVFILVLRFFISNFLLCGQLAIISSPSLMRVFLPVRRMMVSFPLGRNHIHWIFIYIYVGFVVWFLLFSYSSFAKAPVRPQSFHSQHFVFLIIFE